VKKCKTKKQPEKKKQIKKQKKCQKKAKKRKKKQKKTKAKAKGTYKKQNFKFSICIWLQKQIPELMQTNIQITSSKQEEHGTKTDSFYSNNDNDVIKNKRV
jgi:uncharacterized membrane-anchored protein YitT (DUF2179 family)